MCPDTPVTFLLYINWYLLIAVGLALARKTADFGCYIPINCSIKLLKNGKLVYAISCKWDIKADILNVPLT